MSKVDVFLVGAKSIGAYGGYETFVNKLTEYHRNSKKIKYHVACKANGQGYMDETTLEDVTNVIKNKFGKTAEFTYHNARCFKVWVLNLGPAAAIFYDLISLKKSCKYAEENKLDNFIVYVMACRIGPFFKKYVKKIHELGGKVYVNPDGHEWLRAKWNKLIKSYWKYSEKLMVKNADLVVCDSVNIEKYIKESYRYYNPNTCYIAYGAEIRSSKATYNEIVAALESHGMKKKGYYLTVGRFVPENNYETMISEFMKSHTKRDFVLITTKDQSFLNKLDGKLSFSKDKRIKFIGPVYDQEILMAIRQNAYGYFHGHEVGGTNPSLLEALGTTPLNLLLKVSFNEEVARDSALYWTKDEGNLSSLIDEVDKFNQSKITDYETLAKKRIRDEYTWEYIANRYQDIFLD